MNPLWLAPLFLAPVVAAASEPDFYLASQECKMLIASLAGPSMKVAEGDAPNYSCTRQSKRMICAVVYPSGGKAAGSGPESYEVLLDSPPHLYFASANGATFFAVNIQNHAAVVTARLTDVGYAGEKVCSALYFTSSELEMLKKQGK